MENGDDQFSEIAGYVPTNMTNYADTTVKCNTAYSYYVVAFDVYTVSGQSNIATATTMYCGAEKATSEMIQITGVAFDKNGDPVTGTRLATVMLYKTLNDSNPVYEEAFKDVEVRNGYFVLPLGLTGNVANVIRKNESLYYDVYIDGKSVYNKMQPLTSSPYAIVDYFNLSGAGSPVGIVNAPVGASYVDTQNRQLYIKAGPAINDWKQIGN